MTTPAGPALPCGHAFAALAPNAMGITECSACRAAAGKGDRLNGWKEIATALGVDRATAIAWHERGVDPLPVRHDRKGLYASRAGLERWLHAGDMPLSAHTELERLRATVPVLQRLVADVELLKVRLGASGASAPGDGGGPANLAAALHTATPAAPGAWPVRALDGCRSTPRRTL